MSDDIIGNYRFVRNLGTGGMGQVSLAQNMRSGELVALKLVHRHLAESPEVRERFRREVRVLKELRKHPRILPVIETGEAQGIPYFVMPYVDGESLSSRLQRGPLSLHEALRVLRDVVSALGFAHQRGILHRDIKPGNILLDSDGHAYLTDFGIATDPKPDNTRLTRASQIAGIGTQGYMAPEQLEGLASKPQSEVYSLGVVLYEILTGRRFTRSLYELEDPWSLLPGLVVPVVRRATQQSPHHRYESVAALLADFERAVPDAITVAEPAGERTPSAASNWPVTNTIMEPRQQSWIVGGAAAGIILLVGLLIIMVMSGNGDGDTAQASGDGSIAQRLQTNTPVESEVRPTATLITPTATPTPLPTSTRQPDTATPLPSNVYPVDTVLYTTTNANVRAVADSSAEIAYTLPAGTRVVVKPSTTSVNNVHHYNEYYYVQPDTGQGSGWVHESHLSPTRPEPAEVNTSPGHTNWSNGMTVWVSSTSPTNLMLRRDPTDQGSGFGGTLQRGESLIIAEPEPRVGDDGGWWWEVNRGADTGWMAQNYLTTSDRAEETGGQPTSDPQAPVATDSDGDGVPDGRDDCPNWGDNGFGVWDNGCPKDDPNPPTAES